MCLEMPTVLPTTFTTRRDAAVLASAEPVIMRSSVAVPVSTATRFRPMQKEQTLEGVTRSRDCDEKSKEI